MRVFFAFLMMAFSACAAGQQAEWIWRAEGNPTEGAPEGTRFFRKTIDLPEQVLGGWVWIAADNGYELFVNGVSIASGKRWDQPGVHTVSDALHGGGNTLAVKAVNEGGPAGLLVALRVLPAEGDLLAFFSDNTWKTSDTEEPDWAQPAFDDAAWAAALSLGGPPLEPWTEIRSFAELFALDVFPPTITPNGDGVNDVMKISFSYPPGELGGVLIDIVDATGTPVYSFVGKAQTDGELTWDGKYETGGAMANGEYRVSALGQSKRREVVVERMVTVKNSVPWPAQRNVVKGLFPIGIWYDGRVEGINVPEGCTDVPQDLKEAEKYYEKTFTDIKDYGLEIVVIPNTPPAYRETLLEVASRVGVRVVLEIAELAWPEFGGRFSIRHPDMERDELELFKELKRIVRPLQRYDSLLCYQLIDEPPASLFDNWRMVSRLLAGADPKRASFSCLNNERECSKARRLGMQMLVFDRYPLRVQSAPGEYDFRAFITLLDTLKAAAADRPYWMVLQAFASPAGMRYPTPAELRLMTYLSLAHNAKGIFYFLYNSKTQNERLNGLVDVDLNPAPLFDEVGKLARELKALAPVLLSLAPMENTVSGEGADIDVQMFIDDEGVRYVFMSNLDVLAPVQYAARIPGALEGIENVLTHEAVPCTIGDGTQFAVPLGPGEAVLLRLK